MRCRRPEVVCYCRFTTTIETRTRVVILQHPRERDVPINTARIAPLCLPNTELHVGIDWSTRPDFDGRRAILLYPGPGARDIEAEPPQGPVTLVVVDGTWTQTKAVVRDNPRLAALPRYAFRPHAPSDYRIRKEPHEECVSTIEALAHVLGVLEGDPERMRGMLVPFRAMVDAQLAYIARGEGRHPRVLRRKRLVPKADPRQRLPRALLERGDDLVCISGEANAWPYGTAERASNPEEIIHVAAERLATGERFDAIVAPTSALCPSTSFHVSLPSERILAGITRAELESAWSRFIRPSDVACTWGTYASKLFSPRTSARVDVRAAARAWSCARVGTLETFLERLAVSLELGEGPRANRRLAQLVAIVRSLVRPPE
ncbi:MAG TPA: tRNA-uridine aminocarboxypropyltransferase [Polyangiaceae bacterium]|jgi:DTW domain-containing protein YfiP